MIKLRAYAKLNLSLNVTGKRSDGYHELDMIMQSVSLFDVVTVEKSERLSVIMDKNLTDEKNNSAFRAALAFCALTKIPGAEISINKNIPVMSGLGGASADAAAVLTGLDILYNTKLGSQALLCIAEGIGADVPFALSGGTARAKGIGEKITPLNIKKPMYYSVIKPFSGVSTAAAFRVYHPEKCIDIETVENAVLTGDVEEFNCCSGNALQPAAVEICPEIIIALEALKKAGAVKALITGSGSAVFSAFENEEEALRTISLVGSGYELCCVLNSVKCGVEVI